MGQVSQSVSIHLSGHKNDSLELFIREGFNLKCLTEEQLLNRFDQLVRTERKIIHLVLQCIAEIDRRKSYLEKAYSSLYDFLVKSYGYSPSAAMRRIESARLLKELPYLSIQLKEGSLNLTQLSQVQQAVRTVQKLENRKVTVFEKQALLKKIENTTQAQTEVILSQGLNLPIPTTEIKIHHRDESISLTLHLTAEEKKLLEQVRNMLGAALPDQRWASLITYLAKNEIKRRTEARRRVDVKKATDIKRRTGVEKQVMSQEEIKEHPTSATEVESRAGHYAAKRKAIPSKLRKLIFSKNPVCEYEDPKTGRLCASAQFLEIDHIRPIWAGGDHDPKNLRVLCSEHNKLIYRQQAGIKNL